VLSGARVVTPEGVREDLHVHLADGLISALRSDPEATGDEERAQLLDLTGYTLLPGFIDTQVNGGGGVLFNDSPGRQTVSAMADAHARFGTTGLLPTLISDELSVIARGMTAVEEAMAGGDERILGIHIEGPFISAARRGVHDPLRLQTMTREVLEELEPLRTGVTVITLAPEQLEVGMVRQLVAKGFIVSAGHSAATHAQITAALDEGLSGFTHLYNAMSPLTVREPGVVGAALDTPEAFAGIIADGVHVADAALRIALRCKGAERLMLVTDAMPPLGTDDSQFELHGAKITVTDGICRDARGALAGSCLDMAAALRHMLQATTCDLASAARMASTTPAAFLGLQTRRGAIAPGLRADMVVLDERLQPAATVLGGTLRWADEHSG